MGRPKKTETVEVEAVETPISNKSDRQKRWDAHVANYKVANPEKYAHKEAHGQFKTIPDTFQ